MTVARTRGNCQDSIVKAAYQCHQLSATKLPQIRRKQTVATVVTSKLSSTSNRAAKSRPTTRSARITIIYTFTVESAQLAKILLMLTDNCSDWGGFKVYILEEVVCLWLLVTIVSKNCLHCMHRCHMQLRILPLPLRNQQ